MRGQKMIKIYEEALSSVIKRVERLEELIGQKAITPQKKPYSNIPSKKQITYFESLGGKYNSNITKQEIAKLIDKLLQQKEKQPKEEPKPKKPLTKQEMKKMGITNKDLL